MTEGGGLTEVAWTLGKKLKEAVFWAIKQCDTWDSVQLSLPAISQVMGCHLLQFGWLGLLALPVRKGLLNFVEHLPMARA